MNRWWKNKTCPKKRSIWVIWACWQQMSAEGVGWQEKDKHRGKTVGKGGCCLVGFFFLIFMWQISARKVFFFFFLGPSPSCRCRFNEMTSHACGTMCQIKTACTPTWWHLFECKNKPSLLSSSSPLFPYPLCSLCPEKSIPKHSCVFHQH